MATVKHARQQIREVIGELLKGLPTTGARVFTNRPYPLDGDELPAIFVMTPQEISEVSSFGGPAVKQDRQLRFVIGAHGIGVDVQDLLDRMALEIETRIDESRSNTRLTALIFHSDIAFTGTQVNISAEGKSRVGEIRLTYDVMYRTARGAPETPIG